MNTRAMFQWQWFSTPAMPRVGTSKQASEEEVNGNRWQPRPGALSTTTRGGSKWPCSNLACEKWSDGQHIVSSPRQQLYGEGPTDLRSHADETRAWGLPRQKPLWAPTFQMCSLWLINIQIPWSDEASPGMPPTSRSPMELLQATPWRGPLHTVPLVHSLESRWSRVLMLPASGDCHEQFRWSLWSTTGGRWSTTSAATLTQQKTWYPGCSLISSMELVPWLQPQVTPPKPGASWAATPLRVAAGRLRRCLIVNCSRSRSLRGAWGCVVAGGRRWSAAALSYCELQSISLP